MRADSTLASTGVKPLATDVRKVFSRLRITVDLFGINQIESVVCEVRPRVATRGKLVAILKYDGGPKLLIAEDLRIDDR